MAQVFTEEWVDKIRRRYEAALVKPALHNVAVGDRNREVRAQIEAWVELLPEEVQPKVIDLLRNPSRFIHTYNELAVGTLLSTDGFRVHYELRIEGLTPDWLIEELTGPVRSIVDVFTANPSADQQSEEVQLQELRNRLQRIRIPVALIVEIDGHKVELASGQSQKIARRVEEWLSEEPGIGEKLRTEGLGFEVLDYNPDYSGLQLAGPSTGGWVRSDPLRGNILKKVARYKRLGMPIVVAVVPDFYTGLDLDDLMDVLLGQRVLEVTQESATRDVFVQRASRKNNGLFVKLPQLSAVMWVWQPSRGKWESVPVHNPHAATPIRLRALRI